MTGQFTIAITSGCANASSNSSRAEKICGWDGGHPGFTAGFSNSSCSYSQMEIYKVTRGPHYDADTTMAVPEPHYLAETTFTSCFLRKLSCVLGRDL